MIIQRLTVELKGNLKDDAEIESVLDLIDDADVRIKAVIASAIPAKLLEKIQISVFPS